MPDDFLAIIGRQESRIGIDRLMKRLENVESWSVAVESDLVTVLCSPTCRQVALEIRGILIGAVHWRHTPETLDGHSRAAVSKAANAFVEAGWSSSLWGPFVAISRTDGGVRIDRAPFSTINVFFAVQGDCVLLSSQARLLLESLDIKPEICWNTVAHQLRWDGLALRATGIQGIQEVRSGESLLIDRERRDIIRNWDAWTYCGAERRLDDRAAAVELVRREMLRCVGAFDASDGPLLVDMSGGFDSSAIAAILAYHRHDLVCFNAYTPDTEGDERSYARLVADHLGATIAEMRPDPMRVQIARSGSANLPRPYARAFVQEIDRIGNELSSQYGARAFMNGGGGDNVFNHLQTSAPAADRLRSGVLGPRFFQTVTDVAEAAQCSAWDVLGKGVRKAIRGPASRSWISDTSLLSNDHLISVSFDPDPPWDAVPAHVLPGQAEHVLALYEGIFHLNGFERSQTMEGVFPLLSQPLVEACLRIPSWLWVSGGRNRSIARSAISNLLPPAVAARKSKGGFDTFHRKVFEANRETVFEMILDGRLVDKALIDRDAVLAARREAAEIDPAIRSRLMRLCDIEAWIAAWV